MIIKDFFNIWRHYSFSHAFWNALWWLSWYLPLDKLCMWSFERKKKGILSFAKKNYGEIIAKHRQSKLSEEIVNPEDYNIWVFWAQGFEKAPQLVRACNARLNSLNAGRVVNIDLDNLHEYIELPDIIYEKVESKIISLTHFSDIIRFKLLAKYGGLWIDSTCWVEASIPQWIKEASFYSPKTLGAAPLPLCSDSRWVTWCMGTNRINFVFYDFVSEMLIAFASTSNYLMDYLLNDYLMLLAYEEIPIVREVINALPANNENRNALHFLLNEEYNSKKYKEITNNNWLFKLSYKTQWNKFTNDGKFTFFGQITKSTSEK